MPSSPFLSASKTRIKIAAKQNIHRAIHNRRRVAKAERTMRIPVLDRRCRSLRDKILEDVQIATVSRGLIRVGIIIWRVPENGMLVF